MSIQLPWVQVASNVTVSPAQPLHVHVVVVDGSPAGPSLPTAVHTHGGHSFVAAQQPLLPGLEPSAHVAAEAQAAAKTSTRNAVRLRAIDDLVSLGLSLTSTEHAGLTKRSRTPWNPTG